MKLASPLRSRVLSAMAALLLMGMGAGAPAQIVGAAARVNGVEISNFRLERHFDDYVKDKGRNITKMINPKVYKKLKREALDQLIEKELVWQEAQRRGIVVTQAEVDAALKDLESKHKSRDDFLRRMQNAGFDEKSYGEYIRREIAIQRCLDEAFAPTPVTDQDVHDFYLANPDKFTRPEGVHARHILVKVPYNADAETRAKARQRIEEPLAKARKGEDFASLAREYSEDASAESGGDLGAFPRGRMVPEFDEAAFKLQAGEISGVVETQYGLHIIKVDERFPEKLMSEDEIRDRLREYMSSQRRDEARRAGDRALRDKAKIEVYVRLEDSKG